MVSGHRFSWRHHLPSCDGLEMWLRPLITPSHQSPGRICSRAQCWRHTPLHAWRFPSGNLSKPIFCSWCECGEEPGSINLAGIPRGRVWLALIYPSNCGCQSFLALKAFYKLFLFFLVPCSSCLACSVVLIGGTDLPSLPQGAAECQLTPKILKMIHLPTFICSWDGWKGSIHFFLFSCAEILGK